jgi:hypothetical protein
MAWFLGYCAVVLLAGVVAAALAVRAWRRRAGLIVALLPLALVAVAGRMAQTVLNAANLDWAGARLAPVVAMDLGYSLYSGPHDGPVLNTIYAPISYLVYWPMRFFASPAVEIAVASLIGLLCYFAPAVFLFLHHTPSAGSPRVGLRALGVALFVLLSYTVPSLRMSLEGTTHDCPALGFALIACLALYLDSRGRWSCFFLSAVFATLSVWSKQVMAPLLVALPLWTLATCGSAGFRRHVTALAATGVAISLPLMAALGPRTLCFNILVLPAEHAWNGHFPSNLAVVGYEMYRDAFGLVAALIVCGVLCTRERSSGLTLRDWMRQERWSLFVLVALASVPTAFLGRLKLGGSANSFSPVTYFVLAGLLACLLKSAGASEQPALARRAQTDVDFARMILGVGAASFIFLILPQLAYFFRDYRGLDATKEECVTAFLRRHPGEAYFPWQPLPHLLVEGKLYHFAYGLFDRELGGHGVTKQHFQRFVPEHCRYVCFPQGRRSHRPPACLDEYLKQFHRRVELPQLPGFDCYERDE